MDSASSTVFNLVGYGPHGPSRPTRLRVVCIVCGSTVCRVRGNTRAIKTVFAVEYHERWSQADARIRKLRRTDFAFGAIRIVDHTFARPSFEVA